MSRLGRSFPNNALMRTPRVQIPVSYDSTGAGATHAGTGTITESHTLTSSANALVVALSIFSTATPTITVTIGGSNIPLLGTTPNFYSSGICTVSLFGLISPPTGVQTVSASISGGGSGNFVAFNSVSYRNVAMFGTPVATTGSGANASQTVSAGNAQMVTQAFGTVTSGSGAFSGYSQTQRYNAAATSSLNEPMVMGDAPGSASVIFSTTSPGGSSYNWGAIAVPLIPV